MARDLADRETACCPFFRFTFGRAQDGAVMGIRVTKERVDVLDALQAMNGPSYRGG